MGDSSEEGEIIEKVRVRGKIVYDSDVSESASSVVSSDEEKREFRDEYGAYERVGGAPLIRKELDPESQAINSLNTVMSDYYPNYMGKTEIGNLTTKMKIEHFKTEVLAAALVFVRQRKSLTEENITKFLKTAPQIKRTVEKKTVLEKINPVDFVRYVRYLKEIHFK